MASGSLIGGSRDESRGKHKWAKRKIYTKKTNNKGPKNIAQTSYPRTLELENENNSSQRNSSTGFDAASDDSSTLNLVNVTNVQSGNVSVSRLENLATINLSPRSKQEMRELRSKLVNELDQVRNLVKQLESKELRLTGYSGEDAIFNGESNRVNSDVASVRHREPRPLHQLSVSAMEKEKMTPKANQHFQNSDFVLVNDKLLPQEVNKNSNFNGDEKDGGEGEGDYGFGIDEYSRQVFKACSALLEKLMKHEHGWIFNTPVDVKGLGLHDYYLIIKHPMDLGTVKSRLSKNWYKSPREFAEDVRLTFRNAMMCKPKGRDVHNMAEKLLKMFEDKWALIEAEYNLDCRYEVDNVVSLPVSTTKKKTPELKCSSYAPLGRDPALKVPTVKDHEKRGMTYEEKHRLSINLQNLPSEKLESVVQIIKKRNSAQFRNDDEIELDIDCVDVETLWELDRFVTNYKKNLSKCKRKAEPAIQARKEAKVNVPEMNPALTMAVLQEEAKTDEKNVPSSPPVQAERQGDNASRSISSSSESGTSSSDSDSGSASALDAGHSYRT